jgi:hypothetical protein
MRMGMSVDEINKGIAGYAKQQGMLGQLQGRTQADLTKGASAYLREMEGLARLTGQTREEMEKQREEANQIEIFYSTVAQMGEAQQKELYATFNQLKSIDPTGKLALGYANSVSGLVGASEESGQLFMATNGAVVGLVDSLKKGEITSAQFVDKLGAASKETEKTRLSLGQLGAGQDVYGSNLALNSLQNKKAAEGLADVEKGLTANENATDKQTASQVALRQSQMSSRDSLQKLGDTVGKHTTPIMEGFGKVVQGVTGILTGKGVSGGGAQGPAGGAGGRAAPGGGGGAAPGGAAPGGAAPGGAAPGGAAPGAGGADLSGLRIKSPEATSGGSTSEQLATVAKTIQEKLGVDLKHFSAFNDSYHRGPNSKHSKGQALDFTLTDPSKASSVADLVRGIPGINKVIDEYANPSGRATAGHIHAEISAANGAILSGPMSGYKPNLTMHGTEAIVPLNSSNAGAISGMDSSSKLETLMAGLHEQMDAQTRVMRDIADYTKKTSQYAGA